MKEEIKDGEIDRLLHRNYFENKNGSLSWEYKYTAKITPKKFTLSTDDKSFSFEKSSGGKLRIEGKRVVVAYETCSLGHRHEKSRKENEYDWFTIDDDHLESLAEWLRSGTWTDIQGEKAPWKKVMRECLDVLSEVEKRDSLAKPAIQKLKTKIKGVLE